LIRSSSESPNVDVESSLSQVLISPLPEDRYLLSPKAASGILHRSERQGRLLPSPLREALSGLVREGEESADLNR
jgi:DNA (cytosine-5)-methyltransferase 1